MIRLSTLSSTSTFSDVANGRPFLHAFSLNFASVRNVRNPFINLIGWILVCICWRFSFAFGVEWLHAINVYRCELIFIIAHSGYCLWVFEYRFLDRDSLEVSVRVPTPTENFFFQNFPKLFGLCRTPWKCPLGCLPLQ